MHIHRTSYSPTHGWASPLPTVDPDRSLTLCFGSPEYFDDPEAIRELAVGVGGPVIGCSTAGEIHGTEVSDGTLAVAVLEFTSTTPRVVAVPITAAGSHASGRELGSTLAARDLKALFILSDGLDVNGSDLVSGLTGTLPPGVVVTGGLAGDGPRFERTWVIVDGKPASGFATAVGLYGDAVRVGHGSKGGWDIFGPERTVTRSRGNVVYELDGRAVLTLYKEYLGDLASDLPASGLLFPLALRSPGDGEPLVRTILAVNEESQSLVFAGDVPQGHRVQLMQANFDRLVDGAEDAAASASLGRTVPGSLCVAISCVGRRLVLGERTEDELEATVYALPPRTEQVGFYSYGEISPYAGGSCALHNQTMTLTTIGEAA
jgi:hypothetical protein